jgi:flagellar basal body-associated protein FliL
MNGLEIIILIVLIAIMAAGVGYFLTHGQPTLKEMTEDYHKNEEIKEIVDSALELYDKDLRPIVIKQESKIEETQSETSTELVVKKKRKYYPKKKK